MKTVNKLNNLVTNIDATLKGSLNDIITQYKEAINIFKQKLQTVLNIVNIGDNVFDDISSQEYKNLLTITEQRRLNPQHYMQYLKLNLEEAINILQEIDGGGDVTMEETKTLGGGGGIGGIGGIDGIAMTQMTNRKRKREGSPTPKKEQTFIHKLQHLHTTAPPATPATPAPILQHNNKS